MTYYEICSIIVIRKFTVNFPTVIEICVRKHSTETTKLSNCIMLTLTESFFLNLTRKKWYNTFLVY